MIKVKVYYSEVIRNWSCFCIINLIFDTFMKKPTCLLFLFSTVTAAKSLSEDEVQSGSPIVISVAETKNDSSSVNWQGEIKPAVVVPGNSFKELPNGMSQAFIPNYAFL